MVRGTIAWLRPHRCVRDGSHAAGGWKDERHANVLDGAAHFYDTYRTKDGKWVSVGSIEPQFYALLLEKTGVDTGEFEAQMDRKGWAGMSEKLAAVFATKTGTNGMRSWAAATSASAPSFPSTRRPGTLTTSRARPSWISTASSSPRPAPRFSATPGAIQGPPPTIGEHNDAALGDWGFSAADIDALKTAGAL